MPLIKYSRRQRGQMFCSRAVARQKRWRIKIELGSPQRTLLSNRPKIKTPINSIHQSKEYWLVSQVLTAFRMFKVMVNVHVLVIQLWKYTWLLLFYSFFFGTYKRNYTPHAYPYSNRSFRYALTILIGYKCTVFGIYCLLAGTFIMKEKNKTFVFYISKKHTNQTLI